MFGSVSTQSFLMKIFSLKVFLEESPIKRFSRKHYKLFFNNSTDFSKFQKGFLNFVKHLIFLQNCFLGKKCFLKTPPNRL